jgi:hypothetical protein
VVYGFDQFTTNATPATASQYTVEISDGGTVGADHWADFKFTNTCVIPSSITDIYFQDGTLIDITDINNNGTWNAPGNGVNYVQPGSPLHLPGGSTIGFNDTASFNQSAGASGTQDGVDANTEFVTLQSSSSPGRDRHGTPWPP